MEEFVRNDIITVYSKRLINEMRTFVWHSGKPQSMKGYNDDIIMACAIACWIKDTVFEINKWQRQKEYCNDACKPTFRPNRGKPRGRPKNEWKEVFEKYNI